MKFANVRTSRRLPQRDAAERTLKPALIRPGPKALGKKKAEARGIWKRKDGGKGRARAAVACMLRVMFARSVAHWRGSAGNTSRRAQLTRSEKNYDRLPRSTPGITTGRRRRDKDKGNFLLDNEKSAEDEARRNYFCSRLPHRSRFGAKGNIWFILLLAIVARVGVWVSRPKFDLPLKSELVCGGESLREH